MVYEITKFWYYPLCRLFIGKQCGVTNIPKEGKFIVVANHNRLIDPLLIIYYIVRKLNKKVHFIASARLWPYLGNYICREWAGCIPLFNPKQAYKEAKIMIKHGEIVGIFPEGRIDLNDRKIKDGAIRLAMETKTPILPIKVVASYLPFMSSVIFGEVLQPKEIKQKYKNPEVLMDKIYNLDVCDSFEKEGIEGMVGRNISF